jgi:broad specificity phosphatase PhoE
MIWGDKGLTPAELTEAIPAENNNWTRRNQIAELPRGESL